MKETLTVTFILVALNCLFPPREWVSGPIREPSRGFLFYHVNKSGISYRNGRPSSYSRCKIDLEGLIASGGVVLFFGLALAQLSEGKKQNSSLLTQVANFPHPEIPKNN